MTRTQQNENRFYFGFGFDAMKQIKICKKCGAAASAHRIFCRSCGAFLTRKTLFDLYKTRHKTCKKCKTVLPNGAQFCPHCGISVKD